MRNLFIVFALIIFPIKTHAIDEETTAKVETLIEDHMACYSYFKIVEMGFNGSGNTDSAGQYSQLADEIVYRAYVLSTSIGREKDSLQEKIKFYQTAQLEKMNYDFNNFSTLENEYSKKCTDLYNNTNIILNDGDTKTPLELPKKD